MGVIYKSTNTKTGKSYIGMTTGKLEKRKNCHLKRYKDLNRNELFYKALREFGESSFIWEIIFESKNIEELKEMEFHYIKQYKSLYTENGYNMCQGGGFFPILIGKLHGMHGKNHKEKSKLLISKNHADFSGKKNPMYGKKYSKDERKEKGKYYIITYPTGKEREIKGLKVFCEENDLDFGSMWSIVRGKKDSYKGFKCRKRENK